MEQYLYQDLYNEEQTHWWHIAKRKMVISAIKTYTKGMQNIKILDMGCGTGENMKTFETLGEVYGIDSSKDAVAFCKKRGLKNILVSRAEHTHFSDNTFSVITLLDMLEHGDDAAIMEEVYRILSPGGIVVITVPAFSILWSQWDVVLHHKRRYTKKSLTKLMEQRGLTIINASYMYSFLFLPALFIRLIKSMRKQKQYTSDFSINTSIVNTILKTITNIERPFVKAGIVFFGTSIICVAKKYG